jgi:hypothetical protein
MKWMKERDALLAQALAFVESVTGKKEEPARPAAPREPVPPAEIPSTPATVDLPNVPEPAEPEPRAPEPQPIGSTEVSGPIPGDFRTELRHRIATFRKHQERFNRERDEYFTATLAKLRAAINEPPSTRLDK